jgi:prefoldin subunit 5
MAHEQYIERVLSSLSHQSNEELQAQLNRLDSILEQIEKIESPDKEALLVHLILQPHERPTSSEPLQSSV